MKTNIKYICLGLIGAVIGNGLVFLIISIHTSKFGTLADWVSGLGTVVAIFFVYWQIEEQREEFNISNKVECKISITQQMHTEEENGITEIGAETDLYIWIVNSGSKVASFQFLGFCDAKKINNIYTENVIYNPYYSSDLLDLIPHSTNDFELLQPGQVSEENIFSVESIKRALNNSKDFYVLYMDAYKKIYKRLVKTRR